MQKEKDREVSDDTPAHHYLQVVDIDFEIGNLLLLVIQQINLCCAGTELLIV